MLRFSHQCSYKIILIAFWSIEFVASKESLCSDWISFNQNQFLCAVFVYQRNFNEYSNLYYTNQNTFANESLICDQTNATQNIT